MSTLKNDVSIPNEKKESEDELFFVPPPIPAPFFEPEGMKEKMIRKTKENPFVPIGMIFTAVVLTMGIGTMRTGNHRKAQIFMRLRVGGQGLTIFAMLAGIYYQAYKKKNAGTGS